MLKVAAGFSDRLQLYRFGPTLRVQIGFDPEFKPHSTGSPVLPKESYPALIDTGALDSCVDAQLAINLGLPIVDRTPVSGVHGAHPVNVHIAQILIPDLKFSEHGRFYGVHLQAGGQPHFALLGRALLSHLQMVYDGPKGEVSIHRMT